MTEQGCVGILFLSADEKLNSRIVTYLHHGFWETDAYSVYLFFLTVKEKMIRTLFTTFASINNLGMRQVSYLSQTKTKNLI